MPLDQRQFCELLEQAGAGSEDAAGRLFSLYGDHVLRVVRRMLHQRMRSKVDSQDFLQSVWGSLFTGQTDWNRFETPDQLVAFLATIARNKVVEEFRRRFQTQKHRIDREVRIDDSKKGLREVISTTGPTPSELAIAKETWDRVTAEASPRDREILLMKSKGFTCRDIAKQLGINERTVRRTLKKFETDWGRDEP